MKKLSALALSLVLFSCSNEIVTKDLSTGEIYETLDYNNVTTVGDTLVIQKLEVINLTHNTIDYYERLTGFYQGRIPVIRTVMVDSSYKRISTYCKSIRIK